MLKSSFFKNTPECSQYHVSDASARPDVTVRLYCDEAEVELAEFDRKLSKRHIGMYFGAIDTLITIF